MNNNEKIFIGIGAGPIQTGIFVRGAFLGNYDRIILADVDAELVEAVEKSGSITVNTATTDSIITDTYKRVEIYNPSNKEDLPKLIKAAAQATALCTALPSTSFYKYAAPWLRDAFSTAPNQTRYFYTAENSTTAAKELRKAIGDFPATYYLDTVIGKMSKIFSSEESELPPLAPGLSRGHLVEEFNTIYTSSAPGIENAGLVGLYPKVDLIPFEEAKLYGHNATHFMMAIFAAEHGCKYMDQVKEFPEIIQQTITALKKECGAALCAKFNGYDEFFTRENFDDYANELVPRMMSGTLRDSVDRIIRDPARKLGWNDRIIGAIRLCLQQGIVPERLIAGALLAARQSFGCDRIKIVEGLEQLWSGQSQDETSSLIWLMLGLAGNLPSLKNVTKNLSGTPERKQVHLA